MRHFMWQAALAFKTGYRAAKRIGDAHEYGLSQFREDRADSARDLDNNRTARTWAKNNMSQISRAFRRGGIMGLMGLLYSVGMQLYNRGNFTRI